MKKTLGLLALATLLLPAVYAEVLSVDPEATPKPIKITVEGLPDSKPTSLTTQKDVFFKNELFKPAPTQVPVAAIKQMADKNKVTEGPSMESEVIDAIISKLSDMEKEMKAQKQMNLLLWAALGLVMILAMGLFFIKKRKK